MVGNTKEQNTICAQRVGENWEIWLLRNMTDVQLRGIWAADGAYGIWSSICLDQNNAIWQKQFYQWLCSQVQRYLPFKMLLPAHTVHLICTKTYLHKYQCWRMFCYKQKKTVQQQISPEKVPVYTLWECNFMSIRGHCSSAERRVLSWEKFKRYDNSCRPPIQVMHYLIPTYFLPTGYLIFLITVEFII